MENINEPQFLPVPAPSATKKWYRHKGVITTIVLAVTAGVAVWVYFILNQPLDLGPIAPAHKHIATIQDQLAVKIVGPITIQPITPVLNVDQPDSNYSNFIIPLDFERGVQISPQLQNSIVNADQEIKANKSAIPLTDAMLPLYISRDNSWILYIMTPTGAQCYYDLDDVCENVELKLFNVQNNTTQLITKDFYYGGFAYVNIKNNTFIELQLTNDTNNSEYKIYSLNPPYGLIQQSAPGAFDLMEYEYLFLYNPKTNNFTDQNLVTGQNINCAINNTQINQILSDNSSYWNNDNVISLSPDGNKIIFIENDGTILQDNLESLWNATPSICFSSPNKFAYPATILLSNGANWFNNSQYFGAPSSEADGPADSLWLYDLDSQKQILYMPNGRDAPTVGVIENSGYYDSTDIYEPGYKIKAVPGEKVLSLKFVTPTNEQYLIGQYFDSSSTEEFYQLTQKYPPNSFGKNGVWLFDVVAPPTQASPTSSSPAVPNVWARIQADNTKKNLFHIAVFDGYNLRQAVDLTINN